MKEPAIRICLTKMNYGQLKKMSNGWENMDLQRETDILGRDINKRIAKFKIKELIHYELDNIKEEHYHYYCPKCAGRQNPKIKSGTEIKELPEKNCPKHQDTVMEIRDSTMYDTDYELELADKPITWQAMIDCPAGYRKIPYKGMVSQAQIKQRPDLK